MFLLIVPVGKLRSADFVDTQVPKNNDFRTFLAGVINFFISSAFELAQAVLLTLRCSTCPAQSGTMKSKQ